MKFRKNWKRFWTLDRRHAEGFTLVELIVVIAILAILAGVGTVGYSGYVKKANMQADMTLISEIEQALTLAMYGDPFEEESSGVLVLSMNEITYNGSPVVEGSEVDNALKAAFGDGYKQTLKLKYTDWEVASYLNGLSVGMANVIKDSSYLSGNRSEKLLSDVEMFTKMAANLAEAMEQVTGDTTLGTLFTEDLLDATAEKYDVEGPADGESWDSWGQTHPQEFSNLLVLATALDSQNMMDNQPTATSTNLILAFSTYYAFASTCPEFSTFLDEHMAKLDDVDTPSEGSVWYTTLKTEAEKATYKNADGKTYTEYTGSGDTAEMDQVAFAAIMSSLNKTTAKDISGDLDNANLFTDGAVKDVYDQYMNAVNAMAGGADEELELNLEKGQIAIIYNQNTLAVIDTIGE